ncbi:arsenical pump-driving ATPase GET3 [bacterium]|nr:arsenical pump-driving ATPase GET3 [bacterium]MBU4361588.1 arsenical pump-driving ATPase GET3 [bacterium]MBU4602486.1 arsenical pump-driving ATPase GET3 [bacterium]
MQNLNNKQSSVIKNKFNKQRGLYLFFGGKGGVGKTTMSAATAVWMADRGYKTTVVSTDPTVSLSSIFNQQIDGKEEVPIREVKNLCGININPNDAKGVFQSRLGSLMGQMTGALGKDVISTPCAEEMATFDQFVSILDSENTNHVIVFDTAPTGKTLRELAMPFNWAEFMKKQITESKKLAKILNMDEKSMESLEKDKKRYDNALNVLGNKDNTIFSLVLLAERLPIDETKSAVKGLTNLGITVQSLIINEVILEEVIKGNIFLLDRFKLQRNYLTEIEQTFKAFEGKIVPLLNSDVSSLKTLRKVGDILYGG